MSIEVKPADVLDRIEELYSATMWLARLTITLCVLVVLQIIAKVVIFGRVFIMLRRVEALLEMTERHGLLTDRRAEEVKETATEARAAAKDIVSEVKQIPEKVVVKLREDGHSDHGLTPVVNPAARPAT